MSVTVTTTTKLYCTQHGEDVAMEVVDDSFNRDEDGTSYLARCPECKITVRMYMVTE